MTQNAFGFDLGDKELLAKADGPQGDFTPLPAGWYDCLVDKAEGGQTQAGDDKLSMTFVVAKGEHQGRLIFGTFVYGHKKEQVANIARSQMAKIAQVGGIDPKTPEQFEDARVGVKVSVKAAEYERDETTVKYKAKNEIKGIGPVPDENAPTPAPATTAGGRKASW